MEERPNRKLSKQEQARYEGYQQLCRSMEKQGYQRVDMTVDVVRANVLAVVIMLPFLCGGSGSLLCKESTGQYLFLDDRDAPLSGGGLCSGGTA